MSEYRLSWLDLAPTVCAVGGIATGCYTNDVRSSLFFLGTAAALEIGKRVARKVKDGLRRMDESLYS